MTGRTDRLTKFHMKWREKSVSKKSVTHKFQKGGKYKFTCTYLDVELDGWNGIHSYSSFYKWEIQQTTKYFIFKLLISFVQVCFLFWRSYSIQLDRLLDGWMFSWICFIDEVSRFRFFFLKFTFYFDSGVIYFIVLSQLNWTFIFTYLLSSLTPYPILVALSYWWE